MKRIITYLIVLLLSIPLMGQITQDRKQEHKAFNKQRTIKTFKKNTKDVKHPHYQVHNQGKEIIKYTKADKHSLDRVIIQQWDENLSEGTNSWKEEYTYDVNENVSTEIGYYWDGGKWVESEKYIFTFDSNNFTQEIYFYKNGAQWVESEKYDYIYDTSNKMTTLFYSELVSNQWIQYYKIEFTYDGNENLETEILSVLNPNLGEQLKYEYGYDTNNNRTAIIAYEKDNSNQWVYYWTDEYEYDNNGNLSIEIDSYWNGAIMVKDDKYEYFYDANNNTIRDIGYHWNTSDSKWVEYQKYEYHHDLAYSISDVIIPIWLYGNYDYVFYNLVTGYSFYDYIASAFVKTERAIMYYSDYNNALNIDDEILSRSVKLYPNPVDDVLTINSEIPLTKVEVYSILGKKVKEFSAGFNSMRIDNLSNGVYIVRILAEKGSTTRKLIKK